MTIAEHPREALASTADVVAANIRAEAGRQGFTQVALGRAIGMTQNQVTKRWKGHVRWQLEELDAVAAVLGLKVVELMTPTGRDSATIPQRDGRGSGRHKNAPATEGRGDGLPRLDSNQQPSDDAFTQFAPEANAAA